GVDLLAVDVEGDRAPLDGIAEGEPRAGGDVGALLRAAGRTEAGALPTEAGWPAPTEHREDVLEVRLTAPTPGEGGAAPGAVAHPGAAPAPAEGGEDVLEAPVAARTTGGEACATTGHRADRVVLTTLLGVGEDGVRLTDVLELLLGGGV